MRTPSDTPGPAPLAAKRAAKRPINIYWPSSPVPAAKPGNRALRLLLLYENLDADFGLPLVSGIDCAVLGNCNPLGMTIRGG
jgi:hypothetical protein